VNINNYVVSMCGSMIKGDFSFFWRLLRCLEGDPVCEAVVPKLFVRFSKTSHFLKGDMLGFHMGCVDLYQRSVIRIFAFTIYTINFFIVMLNLARAM
jgi:hypothetical protein